MWRKLPPTRLPFPPHQRTSSWNNRPWVNTWKVVCSHHSQWCTCVQQPLKCCRYFNVSYVFGSFAEFWHCSTLTAVFTPVPHPVRKYRWASTNCAVQLVVLKVLHAVMQPGPFFRKSEEAVLSLSQVLLPATRVFKFPVCNQHSFKLIDSVWSNRTNEDFPLNFSFFFYLFIFFWLELLCFQHSGVCGPVSTFHSRKFWALDTSL